MKFRFFLFLFLFGIMLSTSSCSSVKTWQHVYLNDPEMQMGSTSGVAFEDYVYSIRTGSTVAGSKKASGGCGCN